MHLYDIVTNYLKKTTAKDVLHVVELVLKTVGSCSYYNCTCRGDGGTLGHTHFWELCCISEAVIPRLESK